LQLLSVLLLAEQLLGLPGVQASQPQEQPARQELPGAMAQQVLLAQLVRQSEQELALRQA
jgi:hypothetical protein